jgi:diguanylate cyclase (GGDEF)-like protein/PAS domain S-box-containing protein
MPEREADGATLWHGFITDITTRKATEAKVRLLSTAVDQSPASVVITDIDANIEYVNPFFTKVTGFSQDDAFGQNPRVLQSGLTHHSVHALLWEHLTQGKSWVGEFVNKRKNGETYFEEAYISPVKEDDGTVNHYVAVKLDITSRKKLEEEVRQLAYYDTLTKLPNRRMLNDRLNHAMAATKRGDFYGALMFLDLDNFKPLNDTYGHVVGDMLLIEAARRLKACLREVDTAARFGGDEFVVMLTALDKDRAVSLAHASTVAEKIRVALSEVYVFTITHAAQPDTTVEHHCTASIGVVVFNGSEGSQDDVMKWADVAMYEAKEAGRNQIRVYGDRV